MDENAEDSTTKEGTEKEESIDYEKIARNEGWKSKEELGDEFNSARYVGAEEFIKRKPLFETIKSQNKAIKELKKQIDAVVDFSQKNAELAAKRAINELNVQKKEAIKLGDIETVEKIDNSIKDHEKVVDESVKVKAAVPAEIIEWTADNPWFDADLEMQDFATAYCASYAKRNPKEGIEKALEETTKAVKRAFPDSKYFKSRRDNPSAVETHKDDGGDTGGKDKYKNVHLSEEQELCCKAYVKQGVMTRAQYIQKLDEIGEIKK